MSARAPKPSTPSTIYNCSSRCDREHKVWDRFDARYDEAQEIGAERAAVEIPEDASPEEYARAREEFTAADLRRDRQFNEWLETSLQCARAWESRETARRGKAAFSDQRERGQKRAAWVGDVSDAEYRDTLRSAEHKPKKKRRR